jgi:putative membrane protein
MADTTRDHLANERTYLAWVRTALGLIGLGFVLARMGLFLRQIAVAAAGVHVTGADVGVEARRAGGLARGLNPVEEFLVTGVVFLALGTALVAWAGWAYRRNRRAIDAGRYVPASGSVAALTVLVVLGGLIVTALVVLNDLG